MMASGIAWSSADLVLLRVLWDEGLSGTQIGLRIGRTKNAVIGMVHRLMLPARPSPLPNGPVRNHKKLLRAPPITLAPLSSLAGAGTIHIPTRSLAPRTTPSKRPATTPEPKREQVVRKGPQRTCEWPFGEPGNPGFHFCGQPAAFGRPYCADHVKIAYVRRSSMGEAQHDQRR